MAPLTLDEKYDDLVRCADQPLSSYDKLSSEDLEDVINKIWPFLIESITYIPSSPEKNESVSASTLFNGDIRTKLERRLKIQFHLYSEAANRCQQKFPNRKPNNRNKTHINAYLRDSGSLSFETSSIFSLDNISKINIPDFYVFCTPKCTNRKQQQIDYDRIKKYIRATIQTSPYRMLIFKQALKECYRCGNYYQLGSLCLAADTTIETIHFDNKNTVLHECIKLNNEQLTRELIRYKLNIDIDGELGTPLVTAIHYNIFWAVEILLKNGADLTKRHIDWPYLTLYEYCIQFTKIDIKIIINNYITSLIHKHKYTIIQQLIKDGWNIHLKKR
ncbi:unnamed protein product [Adineta steineri]|uniref:Ankyrin repeat protein n=1 Tax=Adineta steineri TaxID=433720 RepID=A0A814PCZ0_9BILA|nr:unnamed protein product [Adineta steineri]CAF4156996.1 unnamed protein product [Adineta steineri]